jgi:hypothetical protein
MDCEEQSRVTKWTAIETKEMERGGGNIGGRRTMAMRRLLVERSILGTCMLVCSQ